MIGALIAYALVAATVFGWVLNERITARSRSDATPYHTLALLPLLWGPVLAGVVLLLILTAVACWWRNRRGARP